LKSSRQRKDDVEIHARSIDEIRLRVLRDEDENFSWVRDDVEFFQKFLF
jgi:hypothetical protein